ncbi:MAG: DUF1810 domain-containing protein [Pedobacter sp.]|nr:MAG: DUF1810 domain-containing protein [Pedobacter sp.]
MNETSDLSRFLEAQQDSYETALTEVKNGRKKSHWMWYIFPQLRGLGFTDTSKYYAINDLKEAKKYLSHPILGKRLIEICDALLKLNNDNANAVFGSPDDLKLRSSITLFSLADKANPIFKRLIDKFFKGHEDEKTLILLGHNK